MGGKRRSPPSVGGAANQQARTTKDALNGLSTREAVGFPPLKTPLVNRYFAILSYHRAHNTTDFPGELFADKAITRILNLQVLYFLGVLPDNGKCCCARAQ